MFTEGTVLLRVKSVFAAAALTCQVPVAGPIRVGHLNPELTDTDVAQIQMIAMAYGGNELWPLPVRDGLDYTNEELASVGQSWVIRSFGLSPFAA